VPSLAILLQSASKSDTLELSIDTVIGFMLAADSLLGFKKVAG